MRVPPTVLLVLVAAATLSSCGGSGGSTEVAGTTTQAAPAALRGPAPHWKAWLCKPGLKPDWCGVDMDVTVISADGARRIVRATAAPKRPIDCFYVYPTVSRDERGNSDLDPGQEEKQTVIVQASRFGQVCRMFAPVYRQRTVYSSGFDGSRKLAYSDVLAAWRDYLAHWNHGRGVVLVGHSQGARILEQLIREQIDPVDETRDLLVSAILLGGGVTVQQGSETGGSFEHVPACTARDQTGCVVAYNTWDRTPPRREAGGDIADERQRLCVNPAAPGSETAAPVTPVFAWFAPEGLMPGEPSPPVDTVWISFPGKYTARCVTRGTRSWLLVRDVGPAGDKRPEVRPVLGPDSGLHAADVSIALQQLVELVRAQGAAWRADR
jgi:hypothetical protein